MAYRGGERPQWPKMRVAAAYQKACHVSVSMSAGWHVAALYVCGNGVAWRRNVRGVA